MAQYSPDACSAISSQNRHDIVTKSRKKTAKPVDGHHHHAEAGLTRQLQLEVCITMNTILAVQQCTDKVQDVSVNHAHSMLYAHKDDECDWQCASIELSAHLPCLHFRLPATMNRQLQQSVDGAGAGATINSTLTTRMLPALLQPVSNKKTAVCLLAITPIGTFTPQ